MPRSVTIEDPPQQIESPDSNEAREERPLAHDRLFDTSEVDKNLGRKAVRGGAITITGQAVKLVLRTAATAILARMLTPEDFGLMAMVMIIVGLTDILNNAGLSMATLQRKQITHAQVSTIFWANIAISCTVMILVAASAPLIGWFYQEPRLVNVTLALSVSIVFGGMAVQHQALMRRSMQFGRLVVVEIGGLFTGIVVAIGMAWWGFGYWALVGMTIASAIAIGILSFMMSGWRPSLPSRGNGAIEMLRFGLGVSSYWIVNYIARNCDNLLIGWRWGAVSLGVYSKAYGLLLLPTAQVSRPAMAAFMPMLCRLQDQPEKFRSVFKQIIRALALLTMPGMALLIVAADAAVFAFLGPQWGAAVPVFQILGFAAIFEPVFSALSQPLIACGKASSLYRMGVMVAIPTIASFIIGLPYGPEGVAAGYSLVNTLVVCPLVFLFVASQTPVRVMDFYRAIVPPFLVAVVAASLLWGIRWVFDLQTPLYVLCVAAVCVLPSSLLSIHLFRKIRNVSHDG